MIKRGQRLTKTARRALHSEWGALQAAKANAHEIVCGTPWEYQAAPMAVYVRVCTDLATFEVEHGAPPTR